MKSLYNITSDLHGHSYYSDGLCSPAQVVDVAVATGIDVIALTDHNTTLGIEEFHERINYYQKTNNKIIGIYGIEVSTEKGHMLFLFENKDDCITFGRYIKVGNDKNNFDEVINLSSKFSLFIIVPHPEVPHVNSLSFDDIDYLLTAYVHLIGSIGLEALNGLSQVLMPQFMLKKHKSLTKEKSERGWKANLFGNSDFHSRDNIGFGVTSFDTNEDIKTSKDFLEFIRILDNQGEVKINKNNSITHKLKSTFQVFIITIRYEIKMRKLK